MTEKRGEAEPCVWASKVLVEEARVAASILFVAIRRFIQAISAQLQANPFVAITDDANNL